MIVGFGQFGTALAISLDGQPKLQAIAQQLVAEKYYTKKQIEDVFAVAEIQQSVLDAMQNPAEYKFTWGKYRKLFLQQDRIEQAVNFWRDYEATLTRAEQQYGVPASIIVAIIGVESKFGKYKGKHKVLDSLVSLVVGYPRRSDFFADELKHFLILTKLNQMDTVNLLGSYAGAVGYPQFISSSYRNYAVDFSGDGKTDLIDQPVDAIGSVANYFVENGWLTGEPVTSKPHKTVPDAIIAKANTKRKVRYTATQLRNMGAPINSAIDGEEKLNVLMLDSSEEVHEKPSANIYIVRAGDTACEVAERFSMSCRQLFQLNGLNSKGTIYRGQRLKIKTKVSQKVSNSKGWTINATNTDNIKTQNELYFFTHENFYVITRYNQSVLYAMAVHDLSVAVQQEKQRQDREDQESNKK